MSNLNVNNLTPLPSQGSNTISISGSLFVRDNVKLGGNITIGDVNTDAIVVNSDFTSSLIPNESNQFDLGASDKRWSSLFVSQISGSVTFTDTVTFGTSTVIIDGNNGNITASNNISASNYVYGHSGSFDYLESDVWVRHTDDSETGIELGSDTVSITSNGFKVGVFRTTDGTVLGHGSFKTSISGSAIHIQGSTIEFETDVTASGDISASANIFANSFILKPFDGKLLFDGEAGNDFIYAPADGQVNLHVGGAQVVTATSNTVSLGTDADPLGSVDLNSSFITASGFMVISQSIFPKNDNTANLGDSNRQWANLHVYTASLAYIQPKGGSGQESITISGSTTFTDDVTFNGTTNIEGTTTTITNLVSTTSSITNLISTTASFNEISSSLIPDADNEYNIGSEQFQWNEGHITSMSVDVISAKTSIGVGAGVVEVSASLVPTIDGASNFDNRFNLGSSARQWNQLHTYSASLALIYPKGGSGLEGITISGSTTFTNDVTINGTLLGLTTASISFITGGSPITFEGDLLPAFDNSFDLGQNGISGERWKNIYHHHQYAHGTASFGNLNSNIGTNGFNNYKQTATMSITYDTSGIDGDGNGMPNAAGSSGTRVFGHLRVIMNYLPTSSLGLTTGSLWVSGSETTDGNGSAFLMVCGAHQKH